MNKMQSLSIVGFAIFMAFCVVPACADSENLLVDPGFEKGGINGPFSDAWHAWGGANTETIYKREGNFAAKLWGSNTGARNYSGFFQDVPATGGKWYNAAAYVRHNSDDLLRGKNRCYVKLEFYNDKLLEEFQSLRTLHARSEARKFLPLSTGRVEAPPGTTVARFVVIYEQDTDNSSGAVLIDDVSLHELPSF
ncbi:MAG: hypothetical protein EOM20_04915 [Spartobacteria bacterium]|nr:hypothetical protein [Spartobacteria bacterium]